MLPCRRFTVSVVRTVRTVRTVWPLGRLPGGRASSKPRVRSAGPPGAQDFARRSWSVGGGGVGGVGGGDGGGVLAGLAVSPGEMFPGLSPGDQRSLHRPPSRH